MFNKKYTIDLITSKWDRVKSNIKFDSVPNIDEFIYVDNQYFKIVNVIHSISKKHNIVEVTSNNLSSDNQIVM